MAMAQPQQPVQETLLNFPVTQALARPIAQIAVQNIVVVEKWGTIKHDFVKNDASQLGKIQDRLAGHEYEDAITYTLECWASQNGAAATLAQCIEFLRARNCNLLAEQLQTQAARLKSFADTKQRRQTWHAIDIEIGSSVEFKTCLVKIIFIGLIMLGVAIYNWPPSSLTCDRLCSSLPAVPISDEEQAKRLIIEGQIGQYLKWRTISGQIHVDCNKLRHLTLAYVDLGRDPNEFLHWLQSCRFIRTLRMHHIIWDEAYHFVHKVHLPDLVEFEFGHDMRLSHSSHFHNRHGFCLEEKEDYLNSMIFFYKEENQNGDTFLRDSLSLNTSIALRSRFLHPTGIKPSKLWATHFAYNSDKKSLVMDGLGSSFLNQISAQHDIQSLTFIGCPAITSDFVNLAKIRELDLRNVSSGDDNLLPGQIAQNMTGLESLHLEGIAGFDLVHFASPELHQILNETKIGHVFGFGNQTFKNPDEETKSNYGWEFLVTKLAIFLATSLFTAWLQYLVSPSKDPKPYWVHNSSLWMFINVAMAELVQYYFDGVVGTHTMPQNLQDTEYGRLLLYVRGLEVVAELIRYMSGCKCMKRLSQSRDMCHKYGRTKRPSAKLG